MSNEEFIGYLEDIKELSDGASTQTSELQKASLDITTYITTINTTQNGKAFEEQQTTLIKALGNITFTLDCYQKKVKTFQVSTEQCASGKHGHLADIFNQVSQDFETNAQSCSTQVRYYLGQKQLSICVFDCSTIYNSSNY